MYNAWCGRLWQKAVLHKRPVYYSWLINIILSTRIVKKIISLIGIFILSSIGNCAVKIKEFCICVALAVIILYINIAVSYTNGIFIKRIIIIVPSACIHTESVHYRKAQIFAFCFFNVTVRKIESANKHNFSSYILELRRILTSALLRFVNRIIFIIQILL